VGVSGQEDAAGMVGSPGAGPVGLPIDRSRGRRRRWLWALVAVVLAAGAVMVALAVAADRYQPVGYGSLSSGDEAFPGLPTGHGIRPVNDLGGFHEDMYIPPQRGTFSLFADITNNGTHPVTITAASLLKFSPFTLTGPVRYSTPGMGGSNQIPLRPWHHHR
jgi:hypothetical protein